MTTADDLAVAFCTGAADARNGRAPKVDRADRSPIATAYRDGYDNPPDWRYDR